MTNKWEVIVVFLCSPEFDAFLDDEVTKETDFVFFWFFSVLFEKVMKSRYSSRKIPERF